MRREQLPISALPAWSKLNDVSFIDINVQDSGASRGFGLVTRHALSSKDTYDIPTLLVIPHDLILSAEAVEEHAKVDQHFQELLKVAGGKTTRGDILLFLLMQITITSPGQGQNVGIQNPWTEYCKILPSQVPVPTMWTDEERVMLAGTSLESAMDAKMSALVREFEALREKTTEIPWCHKCWWEHESLGFSDWILLDAWWRSRCLELPNAGEYMVPCLDMANHSSEPNAYYEQATNGSVVLLLRPNFKLEVSSEITISYGEAKSAAEMLFSYGFIDESSESPPNLILTLEPFPDDPLGKAKVLAFAGQPVVRITANESEVDWDCPFLYLMCLNEEDGLEFKVLLETDGSRSPLRVFWQGTDVSDVTNTFESLIESHELADVFRLRAMALLQDRVSQQLERLSESDETVQSVASLVTPAFQRNALRLRISETSILQKAFSAVESQKSRLLESKIVLRYLGAAGDEEQPEQADANELNEEEDFS